MTLNEFFKGLWVKIKQLAMRLFKKATQNILKEMIQEVLQDVQPSQNSLVAIDNMSVLIDDDKCPSLARSALIECVRAIVTGHESEECVRKLFGLLAIIPDSVLNPIKEDVIYELVQLFDKE